MKSFIIAAVLITILYFGYKFSGGLTGFAALPSQETIITKIIDGDTVVIQGGEHVRLLGIDSYERGERCYSEAKSRLEELVLGKKVSIESEGDDKDQYDRLLRWISLNGESVNEKMVSEGLAIARFYGDSKYKADIQEAERNAIENKIGCLWSVQ